MKTQGICNYCKQEYTKNFEKQKYCCWECSRLASIKHKLVEIKCKRCGKLFMGRKERSYCSRECIARSSKIPKGTIKTGFFKQCLYCGKEFYTVPSINGSYCSQKCVAQSRTRRIIIKKCEICGREFETKKTYQAKTCSSECFSKLKSKPKTALHVIKRNQMIRCSICGYNKYPQLLERHHIDRNRANNDLSNLLILCPTCHDEVHFEEKTGRFTFWKNKVSG